jgi:hypothetical protein
MSNLLVRDRDELMFDGAIDIDHIRYLFNLLYDEIYELRDKLEELENEKD